MLVGQFNLLVLRYGWFWQLFPSIFVHANLLHLALNMFFLLAIGRRMETMVGGRFMLVTFFVSGLTGNLFSLLSGPMVVSVGASGGVLGLYAAAIVMNKTVSRASGSALSSLLILFLFNSIFPGADILAHLGGILAGALIGFILGLRIKRRYDAWLSRGVYGVKPSPGSGAPFNG